MPRKIRLASLALTCMPARAEISVCLPCLYALCVSTLSDGTGLCFVVLHLLALLKLELLVVEA